MVERFDVERSVADFCADQALLTRKGRQRHAFSIPLHEAHVGAAGHVDLAERGQRLRHGYLRHARRRRCTTSEASGDGDPGEEGRKGDAAKDDERETEAAHVA